MNVHIHTNLMPYYLSLLDTKQHCGLIYGFDLFWNKSISVAFRVEQKRTISYNYFYHFNIKQINVISKNLLGPLPWGKLLQQINDNQQVKNWMIWIVLVCLMEDFSPLFSCLHICHLHCGPLNSQGAIISIISWWSRCVFNFYQKVRRNVKILLWFSFHCLCFLICTRIYPAPFSP